jgi:hypothetical protein
MGTIARGSLAAILAAVLVAACGGGGGGGGSSAPNPAIGANAANEMTVTVDRGPTVVGNVNQPFVSVTVCVPGSTTDCQTIDHVLVDTGSTGLRLVADVLSPALLTGMPARQDGSGNDLLECQAFVLGYIWGPVKLADVKLGDLTAANLAIHVVGDPTAPAVPADCSSRGSGVAMNDMASLGAKGILGIDSFVVDCPGCALAATLPAYFTCSGGTCTTVQVATADQVRNPVAALPSDNNGILLAMPSVPATGATNVTGSLTFGIGTRSNNALGSATAFDLDQYGELRTWYENAGYWSFLDSGSNGLFFPDAGIAQCLGGLAGFYCPLSTLFLQAEIAGATTANWTFYDFEVANAATLPANTAYRNLAGPWPGAFSYFDWGMPFFYGRRVFYAIDGRSTPAGNGPYVAF